MHPDWISRLERRCEDWALPNLAHMIVAMNAGVWLLSQFKPEFPLMLTLDPGLILQGQVWRLFTFLFIPPAMSPLWMFFWLYLLFIYATALENEWGDFRFNLFYGIGALSTAAASMLLDVGLTNIPLNATIFLAFAALYPEFELMLFFILPVKVKWLAWIIWGGFGISFLLGEIFTKIALAAGMLNYAVFFGRHHKDQYQLWMKVRSNRKRRKDTFEDEP